MNLQSWRTCISLQFYCKQTSQFGLSTAHPNDAFCDKLQLNHACGSHRKNLDMRTELFNCSIIRSSSHDHQSFMHIFCTIITRHFDAKSKLRFALLLCKSLGFCGTSLDVENFLKGKCVLVSSGNIIHMFLTGASVINVYLGW